MEWATELLVLTALLAAGWIAAARLWSGRRRARGNGEARLLRLCRGDAHQAERLLQGEVSRRPGISRAEAASRAIERYQRDNR